MILNELLKNVDIISILGNTDCDIKEVVYDSRNVSIDSLFVCITGFKIDGHEFASQAVSKGAKCLVVEKDVNIEGNATIIKVPDTRIASAQIANNFYQQPSQKFNLVGVTGTKGKTTTTFMIKSILEKSGQKVGLVGTVANYIGDKEIPSKRTTPEAYELQEMFAEMVEKGVQSVAMEASSQGLKLHRVDGCQFDVGLFTNLSKDHIGENEHSDMEDYLNSKIKLFEMCKKSLINIDSEYASKVIEKAKGEVLTFGIKNNSDIKASNIVTHSDSVEFKVETPWGSTDIKVNVPGMFSIYNALGAIGACGLLGISLDIIKDGLKNICVPGRAEIVDVKKDYTVMIDYAHSPDSLLNILTTVKAYVKGRLVCLFGCGGDRDNTKRPIMGKIAGEICDFCIITSDNPRSEDPKKILLQIEEGIMDTKCPYVVIENRKDAIEYALQNAKKDDIIILAGKGHETYQELKDGKIHFDEREVIREILDDKK